ncbi:MAG: alkaline shock response membrane anchor protein AmaP [Oscillospiraceae bacterium]|nr:alkaline shock response membrane anchor protein AmaP [Oscillospiraceae bacterium]
MKMFDKMGLVIFASIVLIIAVVMSTVVFGWLEISTIADQIEDILDSQAGSNVFLGVQIVLIALAIKSIFFNSYSREEMKNRAGITLENDNGKLVVSRDAVENLTNLVVKNFDSVENVTTKVIVDKETNMSILITLFVHPDAIIKDLTSKLQTDIKEAIKKSLNVEVKEVSVRVKDITVKKEPTLNA